jgi:hypothetical protein
MLYIRPGRHFGESYPGLPLPEKGCLSSPLWLCLFAQNITLITAKFVEQTFGKKSIPTFLISGLPDMVEEQEF